MASPPIFLPPKLTGVDREAIPVFGMMAFAVGMAWKGRRNHPNKAAPPWSPGSAAVAFFGAGAWGGLHTLRGVKWCSHGTQITAARGRLSFQGAYVALNLAMFSDADPARARSRPTGSGVRGKTT